MNEKTAVNLIAEIGVNHNGQIDIARRLVVAAKNSGADAVKFQTFTAKGLVTGGTPKVAYQRRTTNAVETHYEMTQRLELSEEGHREMFEFCQRQGIEFLSTPYDVESVNLLERLGVKRYKLASADLVDLPLLERIAQTGKDVLLSVGMATLGDVEDALAVFGDPPRCRVTLLHCVSNYPCSDESLNLSAMQTLRHAFQLPVGFSDHSFGYEASVMSVALGATVIEKHFTLDRSLPGPDHAASSTPEEFEQLANAVRRASRMMGNAIKRCQPEEYEMARVSRKSITLTDRVRKGEIITRQNLRMMRPGTGLPAKWLPDVVGKRARTDLQIGKQIAWCDLE